jgi:hypothetical protein
MKGTGAYQAMQRELEKAEGVALSFGPGIIAGPRAATTAYAAPAAEQGVWAQREMSLPRAETLEKTGSDRDEIFDKTGWMRGADNKWRFTIPDEGAMLKKENMQPPGMSPNRVGIGFGTNQKLGDILTHDKLYEAYPHLADIPVKGMPIPDILSGLKGSFTAGADGGVIHLAPGKYDAVKSTLLHEVQHAVQNHEGFARGGNVEEFLPPTFDQNYLDSLEELKHHEDIMGHYGFEKRDVLQAYGMHQWGQHRGPPTDPIAQNFRDSFEKELGPNFIEDYKSALRNHMGLLGARNMAFKNYLSLAGEVEARAVQEQLKQGRWDEPPWRQKRYVPYEEQIVKPQEDQSLEARAFSPVHQLIPVDHDPFTDPLAR